MQTRLLSIDTDLIKSCQVVEGLIKSLGLEKSMSNSTTQKTFEGIVENLINEDKSINTTMKNTNAKTNANTNVNSSLKTNSGATTQVYEGKSISEPKMHKQIMDENSLDYTVSGMFIGVCFKHENRYVPFQAAYHSLQDKKFVIIKYKPTFPYGNTLENNYQIVNMPFPSLDSVIQKTVELTELPVLHFDTMMVYNGDIVELPKVQSGYAKNDAKSAHNYKLAIKIVDLLK
jgi:hypothetical protein